MKKEACTCWQGYGSADPPVRQLLVDHLVRCRLTNECTRVHVHKHGRACAPPSFVLDVLLVVVRQFADAKPRAMARASGMR